MSRAGGFSSHPLPRFFAACATGAFTIATAYPGSAQIPAAPGTPTAPVVTTPAATATSEPAQDSVMRPLPLQIAGGDLLDVQVFGTPELSGRERVDQFGNINPPVGEPIHVAGLTAAEAGHAIEERLKAQHFLLEPHVSVFVTEYITQLVTVLGEVRKAGPVPLYGAQSLYDVLAAAGGLTALAGGTIAISHRNDPSPPTIIQVHSPNYNQIEHTTQIRPGDTVVVSQTDLIYVLGAVNRQGSLPLANGVSLSVLEVLALSSGLSQTAKASKAAIVRQTPEGVKTINVDLRAIQHLKAPNFMMQAADILVVPQSTGKIVLQTILPPLTNTAIQASVTAAVYR